MHFIQVLTSAEPANVDGSGRNMLLHKNGISMLYNVTTALYYTMYKVKKAARTAPTAFIYENTNET